MAENAKNTALLVEFVEYYFQKLNIHYLISEFVCRQAIQQIEHLPDDLLRRPQHRDNYAEVSQIVFKIFLCQFLKISPVMSQNRKSIFTCVPRAVTECKYGSEPPA